jgi:very-short-patch-repair endonuclease
VREREMRARRFAKRLRARLTEAEAILWSRLRKREQPGALFRRQHPIGPYIADFACLAARVVVEIDGATHGSEAELEHDARRDAFMAAEGWLVMRFSNDDVRRSLGQIMDAILRAVMERASVEAPSAPSGHLPRE